MKDETLREIHFSFKGIMEARKTYPELYTDDRIIVMAISLASVIEPDAPVRDVYQAARIELIRCLAAEASEMPETPRDLPRIPFALEDEVWLIDDDGEIGVGYIYDESYGRNSAGREVWCLQTDLAGEFWYPDEWGKRAFATEAEAQMAVDSGAWAEWWEKHEA